MTPWQGRRRRRGRRDLGGDEVILEVVLDRLVMLTIMLVVRVVMVIVLGVVRVRLVILVTLVVVVE